MKGTWSRRRYSNSGRGGFGRGSGNRKRCVHPKNIEITGVNLFAIIAIIGLAVLMGFLTTKFVVYPLILGEEATFETDFGSIIAGHKENENSDTNSGNEESVGNDADKANLDSSENQPDLSGNPVTDPSALKDKADNDIKDAGSDFSGYSIQYGSFSTEDAANELVSELRASGLTAQIVRKDDMYKVIGQLFKTKEEAVSAKNDVIMYANPEYADVFVTNII